MEFKVVLSNTICSCTWDKIIILILNMLYTHYWQELWTEWIVIQLYYCTVFCWQKINDSFHLMLARVTDNFFCCSCFLHDSLIGNSEIDSRLTTSCLLNWSFLYKVNSLQFYDYKSLFLGLHCLTKLIADKQAGLTTMCLSFNTTSILLLFSF